MKLSALIAALILPIAAFASDQSPPDLPKPESVAIEVYRDETAKVAVFPETKQTDQGHPSIVILLMYNPLLVEDLHQIVAADVGRIEFDCKLKLFQIDTDYELDNEGHVVNERTQDEKTGWKSYDTKTDVILKSIAAKACSKG